MSDNSPQQPAQESGSVESSAKPAKSSRKYIWIWIGFAALAYVCDQLTKWWVTSTMYQGEKTPVIPGLLQWYYIKNPGAAFSIGVEFTWVFTLIMAAVAIFIIVLARRIGSIWWGIGLGLLLGGALGNLTDRLFREPSFGMGHVVDFISVRSFAIFNMADMGVVGGVITICILTLVGIPIGGKIAAAKAAKNSMVTDEDTKA